MKLIKTDRGNLIKAWIDYVPLEDQALQQLKNLADMPFIHKWVSAMPDSHLGKGACVGSVIATDKAIIPASVGVDIGCLDKDTEFLSPNGWVKMSEYSGSKVMQFSPDTGLASYVTPTRYIKKPSSGFYHVRTKYGVDQMLSPDHKVLYYKHDRSYKFSKYACISAQELYEKHSELVLGFRGRFLTCFTPTITTKIEEMTDAQLRVAVMVSADGCIRNENTKRAVVRVKKDGKKVRIRELLCNAGITYSEYNISTQEEVTEFSFASPTTNKVLNYWEASIDQLKVIVDEIMYWDGNMKDQVYFTRNKESADFVQYAMSALGYRSYLKIDHRDSGVDYRVFKNTDVKVGICGTPKTSMTFVPSSDGLEYCFTVPSGFFVARRAGNVFITGNCGMQAVKTSLKASDLPNDLSKLRLDLESVIPVGFGKHDEVEDKVSNQFNLYLKSGYEYIEEKSGITHNAVYKQLGTLGGGNHFIEICIDEEQCVWVMLHSGSRGIGNRVGTYYISKAKEDMEQLGITLVDRDLAYLTEESNYFDEYIRSLDWCQKYAQMNRNIMMRRVLVKLRDATLTFTREVELVDCHHNYVSRERHYGKDVYVTRKGAVNAEKDKLGIIPSNMGNASYIVRGLGNEESFCSCSHGAGRVMSRTQAKKLVSLEQHALDTQGVECRKADLQILDETPSAYKNIEDVMRSQEDLVEIVAKLKQVLCIKG